MTTIKKPHDDLKTIGLMVFCTAFNVVLSQIVLKLGIPLYFDCIGTIVAAITGGFLPGVVVGFLTNVLIYLYNKYILFNTEDTTIFYCVVSVLIALIAAAFAQKKYFKKISIKLLIPITCFVLVGGGIGSVITWGLYGNTLGDELASSLAGRIYTNVIENAFWAQMYAGLIMDIPDKLFSALIAFGIAKLYPKKFRPSKDRIDLASLAKKGFSLSGKIILSVTLIFGMAAAVVTYVSFNQFRETMVKSEGEYAKDTATFAATLIDANMVDEYLRLKDTADGYNRISRYYSLILNSSDRIQYLYVYQMQEDGCHVVFDTDTADMPGSD